MTKGKIQQQVADWRARVEDAPNPFNDPGAFGNAGHALEEAGEFWKAMLRTISSANLRRVADHEAEPIDKELGQLAFMVCSTASSLDIDLPDHAPDQVSDDPVLDALFVARDAAEVAISLWDKEDELTWIEPFVSDIWETVCRLANRLNIDIGAEIDAWMAERYEKAWGVPYVSGN